MNKDENLKKLKTALTNREPIRVYIDAKDGEGWFDLGIMYYQEKYEIYQGEFGMLKMESVIQAINGLIPHLKIEVSSNDE